MEPARSTIGRGAVATAAPQLVVVVVAVPHIPCGCRQAARAAAAS